MRDDFFVGYLGRLPATMRGIIPMAAIGLLVGFVGGALAISAAQDDPGGARIVWSGSATAEGVLFAEPYPHLRTAPTDAHPDGQTIPLSRVGKAGVGREAMELNGRAVQVKGDWSERGEIRMLQLRGRDNLVEIQPQVPITPGPIEDLGRWRIAGEICDGKCYLGAMRPGVGLAHKACANFCIIGGAPPVFVAAKPVEGTQFMLIADSEGRPLDQKKMFDLVALLIELEGRLERWGDLLMFKVDLDAARAL